MSDINVLFNQLSFSVKVILQLINILAVVGTMSFIAIRFKYMRYTFWEIIIRAIFWKDLKPLEWLTHKIQYLVYLIFEVGEFFILLGLLHRLWNNTVNDIPIEFVIGAPLSFIAILYIFVDLFNKVDARNPIKEAYKKNIKNHKLNKQS